jgi:HrpA-like RNA helicase
MQALDHSENLTPLGRHLSQLPLDVHVGKMLVNYCCCLQLNSYK